MTVRISEEVNMNEFLQRLSSRKFWAPIIVSAITVYNAWGVSSRELSWTEIVSIASIWGVFIGAEGIADIESRKIQTNNQSQPQEGQ